MYIVEFTKKCERELSRAVKSGEIDQKELLVIYEWVQEMENQGPEYISSCGYWYDHALKADRLGERSSSFSDSGRIIYKVNKRKVLVKVLKITPTHEY